MNDSSQAPSTVPASFSGLGYWNIYFLLKFTLFYYGLIDLHAIENLAFLALLIVPVKWLVLHNIRHIIAIAPAIWLLHFDSWLPPLDRLFTQSKQLQNFDSVYLLELISRFINFQYIAIGLIIIVAYIYFRQWIRFTTVTTIGLLAILVLNNNLGKPLVSNPSALSALNDVQQHQVASDIIEYPDPEQALQAFYRQQSQLKTTFPTQFNGESFDIIMLNICSLAWDDLSAIGLRNHPLFSQFDVVFNQFNSATSYSGPAAIRLLKASCGQKSHADLYNQHENQHDNQCLLFENLKKLGFNTDFAMNHNGQYDDFIGVIKDRGHINQPLFNLDRTVVSQHSFAGNPIYSDLAVLSNWWQHRLGDERQRTALYYNSISLHDGNKQVSNNQNFNSIDTYRPRASQLFNDITKFLTQLEQSERNVIVLLVPEHGASLKGDKMQIAGMREIPGPNIVRVPVGVKFIGKSIKSRTQPLVIEQPSSYLAISQLLANVLAQNPYNRGHLDLDSVISNLPEAPMVAENDGTVMLIKQGKPYIKLDDDWMLYPGY